jgi:glucose-6-phosphate dehydrogenase assembly protein OpcA
MVITLSDTTSAKISSALLSARRSAGSPASGMVLTLIIVSTEDEYGAALEAAMAAGREHPCRILLVVSGNGKVPSLDAEVRIGEGTSGEVVVVRMRGPLGDHPASVIRPLLLPDSPVVVWWPGSVPTKKAASDSLADLSNRRLTDASASAQPRRELARRAEQLSPGDTDLSWTRLTPWRTLLAAALDQFPARVTSVVVESERSNPSADLLTAWLESRLKVPAKQVTSSGPGITAVRMTTAAGDIAITRPDGLLARYAVPGQPTRLVALKRRPTAELIAEELRRMDHDPLYEQTLDALLKRSRRKRSTAESGGSQTAAKAKKTTAKKNTAKKTAAKKTAAKKTATKSAPARGRKRVAQR